MDLINFGNLSRTLGIKSITQVSGISLYRFFTGNLGKSFLFTVQLFQYKGYQGKQLEEFFFCQCAISFF